MKLEDQLKDALRRQEPPAGFAERVIAQAGPATAKFRTVRPKRRLWFVWPSLIAAAAAVVMSVGVVEHRHSQEEIAARQAIQALQMVAEELNVAQNEVLNK